MRVKHLALISIIAAISLLAFVSTIWLKPFDVQGTKQISHSEQLFCSVPTSSSVYIAEVKPSLAGFGSDDFAPATLLLPLNTNRQSFEQAAGAQENCPCPLWLLHRSLLI